MIYKFDYKKAACRLYPNSKDFYDTSYANFHLRQQEFKDMTRLQSKCLEWLMNNLHAGYTFEIYSDDKSKSAIETIMFRYAEDLVAFRLRFGL